MARRRGVRVIAGAARGRRLAVPDGERVRPTKDRVKEAVFSALDARDALVDAAVLDLFAGSGSLAIEALSRGARAAVLVECDGAAVAAIEQNLATLRYDDVARVVCSDVDSYLQGRPPREAPFDLVFVDPPYDVPSEAVAAGIAALGSAHWCSPSAVVVVERSDAAPASPVLVPGFEVTWSRAFGDTLVTFLQS